MFFCVFMFSEVLKVEFTKVNIQRFPDLFGVRRSFNGHIDLHITYRLSVTQMMY